MESIQNSAVIICIAPAVVAVIRNFASAEKLEQPMKLLLSAFAVLSLLIPIKNIFAEFPKMTEKYKYKVQSVDYNERAENILSEQTSAQIKNMLGGEGVEADVNTLVKIDGENGIYIQSVRIDINISLKSREQEIRNLILKKTGTEPQIEFKSEE